MNGFIIHTGEEPIDARRILPPAQNLYYEVKRTAGAEIVLWGNTSGDIQFVEEADERLFLLSGYVTEIECGPEFVTQEEACRLVMKAVQQCQSHAEIREYLMRIHGSFSFVCRDLKENATLCITDRMASRPLWIAWDSTRWIVSTHVTAVALAIPKARLSVAGLAAFLVYGGPIDPSSSIYDKITAVAPGTVGRLMPGGGYEETRWYTFQHVPDNRLGLSEWVDLAAKRLVNAAGRLSKRGHRPAVFFSGGTDSRLAAAALKAAGGTPLLITLSDGLNVETRVAAQAAKALGLEQKVILRDKHWYLRNIYRAMYEAGGIYIWGHGHFAVAAQQVAQSEGVDAFVLGDMCEAFSKLLCDAGKSLNNLWTTQEFVQKFDSIHLPLYRPQNREATLALLNKRIRSEAAELLRKQIAARYEHLRTLSSDPLIVGDLAFRWESVALSPTFFMFLDLRSAVSERNMMFDYEVHDLLEHLPACMRNSHNLGALLIKRLAPRAAWVVNSNSLLPMFWPPMLHKASKRIKPLLGSARRALLGKSHITTGSWQDLATLYLTDSRWRCFIDGILNEVDHFDSEIFDRDIVRNSWRAFIAGDLKRWGDVDKLLQLGILNQMLRAQVPNIIK